MRRSLYSAASYTVEYFAQKIDEMPGGRAVQSMCYVCEDTLTSWHSFKTHFWLHALAHSDSKLIVW